MKRGTRLPWRLMSPEARAEELRDYLAEKSECEAPRLYPRVDQFCVVCHAPSGAGDLCPPHERDEEATWGGDAA